MIHASYQHRKGTDLTRLAPDPNTLLLPAERTFLQHPPAHGMMRYPRPRARRDSRPSQEEGQAVHSRPARLQRYQRPAQQPGFPEEEAGLPLL